MRKFIFLITLMFLCGNVFALNLRGPQMGPRDTGEDGDMTKVVYDTNDDGTVDSSDVATALAANGDNCLAGSYPLGVDASGVAESCTDASTEINSIVSTHAALTATHGVAGAIVGTTDTQVLTNKTLDADSNTVTNIGSSEIKSEIITGQTEDLSPVSGDFLLSYDTTAGTLKKIDVGNLPFTGSSAPFVDTTSIVEGSVDDTKEMRFEVDGLTTGTVRVVTVQDSDGIMAYVADLLDLTGVETITGNWVNTTFPWADNEVANDITLTNVSQVADVSANGASLVTAANFAAMRGLLDLEAGTDFYSISAADAAFQSLDADLTTLANSTAWRLFYSNGSSVIIELALGADGTFLMSNGASVAPTFDTPAGAGDMAAAVYDAASITEQLVGLTATQTLTNKTINDFTNNIDADRIHKEVRNESGSPITIGQLVYISGYSVGQDLPLVSLADANGSGTFPAFGIVEDASIANNNNGAIIVAGKLNGFDTSAFSAGDTAYMSETPGALSAKPTGTSEIQAVGTILRSHATLGVLEMIGAQRTNDLPNLPDTKLWIGDSGGVPQEFTLSGDITVTAGGVVAVADDSHAHTVTSLTVNAADIADVSLTQAELSQLETLGVTTISANQWITVGGMAETLTSTELNLLDGITVLSGSNTGDEVAATDSVVGVVELATIAETDTGTDDTRALTSDALQGSARNLRYIVVSLVAGDVDVETATIIGGDFVSPFTGVIYQSDSFVDKFACWNSTAGVTGTQVVDVHLNGTTIMDTNKIDTETTEKSSADATTQPDLTTTAISAGDILTFDVDAVHSGTVAKGLVCSIPIRET